MCEAILNFFNTDDGDDFCNEVFNEYFKDTITTSDTGNLIQEDESDIDAICSAALTEFETQTPATECDPKFMEYGQQFNFDDFEDNSDENNSISDLLELAKNLEKEKSDSDSDIEVPKKRKRILPSGLYFFVFFFYL